MKYNRSLIMYAMSVALFTDVGKANIENNKHWKETLKGSHLENVNIGESPIYMPSRSQKIKSKRLRKRIR